MTPFWHKNGRQIAESGILTAINRFFYQKGSNVIRLEFWDHTWSPLIKANVLDHKIKGAEKFIFGPHRNFKTWVLMRKVDQFSKKWYCCTRNASVKNISPDPVNFLTKLKYGTP